MWRPNIISGSSPGPTDSLPGRAIANTYAMGWSVADYRGERIVNHGGGSPGGISSTYLIPGRNAGFCVFTNAEEGFCLRALRQGIADLVMDKANFDWIADGQRLEAEGVTRSLAADRRGAGGGGCAELASGGLCRHVARSLVWGHRDRGL